MCPLYCSGVMAGPTDRSYGKDSPLGRLGPCVSAPGQPPILGCLGRPKRALLCLAEWLASHIKVSTYLPGSLSRWVCRQAGHGYCTAEQIYQGSRLAELPRHPRMSILLGRLAVANEM